MPDVGSEPIRILGILTGILYDRSSPLSSVSETRRNLFCHRNRTEEKLPPTWGRLAAPTPLPISRPECVASALALCWQYVKVFSVCCQHVDSVLATLAPRWQHILTGCSFYSLCYTQLLIFISVFLFTQCHSLGEWDCGHSHGWLPCPFSHISYLYW